MQILELVSPAKSFAGRNVQLSPAQRKAFDGVLLGLERGSFVVLRDLASDGKTAIFDHVQAQTGGARVGAREFLATLATKSPVAMEEAFVEMVEEALAGADLVLVDDLNRVKNVLENCSNPRAELFDAGMSSILEKAARNGKKMVFATDHVPAPLWNRAHIWNIPDLAPEDYTAIWSAYIDPAMLRRMNFAEIHQFAPSLNAHQLRKAAEWLAHEPGADTARALDYLAEHNLASNVDIAEVEAVDWNDLKGVDDVIRELEAKVALPFESPGVLGLNLKPKRGVLLAGPPGTGKTTIGRALAHRLKGKFFLIDGTLISGSRDFHAKVNEVFEAARRNAPAVVFIDDADVIFEGEDGDRGLYRYLLTKLDGLESASAGRVCVMMTAMQASNLPAAILRSGRVELWLETRLPDDAARAEILHGKTAGLPEPLGSVDVPVVAKVARGLTGADLKAVVEDAKLLFAHDIATGSIVKSGERYFREAIDTIRKNRRNYLKRSRVDFAQAEPIGFKQGVSLFCRTDSPKSF
jgi:transitional endoplasmic reticulum ATPase